MAGDARGAQQDGLGQLLAVPGPDGLLIGYLETSDFEAAKRAMEETDVNARWQAEMAPFFEGELAFERLEEVFHLD